MLMKTAMIPNLYRREKFQHPPPGASANEITIALYAIEGKISHPSPGASANETTIALYAIKEWILKNISTGSDEESFQN